MLRRSLKQNMINDLESDLGGGESSRSSWGSDLRPITMHVHHHHSSRSDSGILLVDNSAQTDTDLLEMFLGLRRRMRADNALSSEYPIGNSIQVGATINAFNAFEKSNDGFESGESDYLISSRYSEKHGSREPETPETLEDDVIESQRLLLPQERSLLMASGESSPLLGVGAEARYRAGCESTSEESLSDREQHDFDELDDLLADACPHEGSFGSIHNNDNQSNGQTRLSPNVPHSAEPSPTSDRSCSSRNKGLSLGIPRQQQPAGRSGSLLSPDAPLDSFQNFLKSRGSVIPCVNGSQTQDVLQVESSLRPTASAPLLMPQPNRNGGLVPQHPDPRPLGWGVQNPPSPNSDHSSGHSEYSLDIPKHISSSEPAATATISPDNLSTETNGSTQLVPSDQAQSALIGTDHPLGAAGVSPVTPPSTMPGKEDSISKFQEFLKTRGVDLDLSVVQSSDV